MARRTIAAIVVGLLVLGGTVSEAQAAPATAVITGRVLSDSGSPIRGVVVSAGSRSDPTSSTGTFVLSKLAPGTYAIEFVDPRHRYVTEFLGDSATRDGSRTVTVVAGDKRTGITERLAHAAAVSVTVSVNGTAANRALGSIEVSLTDAAGDVVSRQRLRSSSFVFRGVAPGSYTLAAAEAGASYPHLVPASTRFTLVSRHHLTRQRLDLRLVRGVVQASAVATSVTHVGSRVTVAVRVSSYTSVARGTVTLKYHGVLHHATTVGAGGRVSITIPTSRWRPGARARVDVLFDGPMGVASSVKTTHFRVH